MLPDLVVATHNLMQGRHLSALIEHYQALHRSVGLHVLCLQEDGRGDAALHGARIAAGLGAEFRLLTDPVDPSVSIVYDGDALECSDRALVRLPSLERLSWLERRYIRGGVPDRRHAHVARLRVAGSKRHLAVASFHLDCAGTNAHRFSQVEVLAKALGGFGRGPIVACGDTNTFTLRRGRQRQVLDRVLKPLTAIGVRIGGHHRPTHFFARIDEPFLAHRIGRWLGRRGIDWPLRYDVVCSSLPVAGHGQRATPGSDHDLVWSRF
jgi:hypothetical protein